MDNYSFLQIYWWRIILKHEHKGSKWTYPPLPPPFSRTFLLSSPSSIPLSLSPSHSLLFHPSQRKNSTEEISCSVEQFRSIVSSFHLRYHPLSSSRELVHVLYLSPTLTFSETSSLSVEWILSKNLSKYLFYLHNIIIKYYMYYRSIHTVASFLFPYILS